MWLRLILPFILSFVAIGCALHGAALAQIIDPHTVYETRCARCHAEHSGDFSRKSMIAQPDGLLVGRQTGTPMTEFLASHRGAPTQAEIAALIDMFARQLRTGGLYKRKCSICHVRAKRLARVRLDIRDGRLVDRVTGRDITAFLKEHGQLDPGEVRLIDAMLRWQLKTAGR
ncbi:MAG: hypothetical protein MPJ78_14245 [Hyphomicrobiaceae bacterium]|nr:hypothetical protein [Hyphomicrobiaceae bacterium]